MRRPAPGAAGAAGAAGIALAVVLLSGCGGVGDLLGAEDEGAGVPEVGRCYDTPDSVLPDAHDPTAPVDCDRPHTLETYAVLRSGAPLEEQTLARMGERCTERIDTFLGDDFRHTTVSVYFFGPSRAQREQGARWVRCDAGVVTDTAVAHVRRVTGSLEDAFSGGVPRTYRRCLDAPPDPARAQPLVPCLRPHVAELLPEGIDLGTDGAADRAYPGTRALVARADAKCARSVPSALPEATRTMVIVPTRQMWAAGRTTAQCWGLAPPGERLNESEAQPA